MAKILIATSGLTGIANASLALAVRLRDAGHVVTCASPQPTVEAVSAQGLPYLRLAPINFNPAPSIPPGIDVRGKFSARLRRWTGRRARIAAGIEALGMQAFVHLLDRERPDLLLLDCELHEHIITAVSRAVPVALLSPFLNHWRSAALPPLQSALIPGHGFAGSPLGLTLAWWRVHAQRWWFQRRVALRNGFCERRAVLLAYAKQVGFDPGQFDRYSWVTLLSYRRLPVLSTNTFALEFPHTPPAHLHYLGAMVRTAQMERAVSGELASTLAGLYAQRQQGSISLLYCNLSTMGNEDQAFARKLIQAVGVRPDWRLILGLGGQTHQFASLPRNVHAFDWLPQLQVLAHADCAITHGGVNTINECIDTQVPMLVCSGERYDQPGCAARVRYHGIGLCTPRVSTSVEALNALLNEVMESPRIREALRAMHLKLRADHTKRLAESVIEALLHARQPEDSGL